MAAAYTPTQQPDVQIYPPLGQKEQHQQQQQPLLASTVAPGLENLLHVSQLVVKQKKEMMEIFTGWERNNRYEIYNESGQLIYFAAEDTNALALCCLRKNRPFCIRIFDASKRPVIMIKANINFCTQEVIIQVPEGTIAGSIKKEFALLAPSFFIKNAAGDLMFKINSPMSAACGSFGDVKFDILSADQKTKVGQISKQWGGFFKEALTDADTFGITLPPDMDIMWKAVLLATLFHIDFTFYEQH